MWVKKPYKSYKGFRYVWESPNAKTYRIDGTSICIRSRKRKSKHGRITIQYRWLKYKGNHFKLYAMILRNQNHGVALFTQKCTKFHAKVLCKALDVPLNSVLHDYATVFSTGRVIGSMSDKGIIEGFHGFKRGVYYYANSIKTPSDLIALYLMYFDRHNIKVLNVRERQLYS